MLIKNGRDAIYQGEIPELTVLIVDDEEILVRELTNLILKNKRLLIDDEIRKKITVLSANNGIDALEMLKDKKVNLILLDIVMPMMDGYEICKTLRRNPDFNHCEDTPIFFISGAVRDTTEQLKGLELEADHVFTKPFEPLLIGNYIKKELRRQIIAYQRALSDKSRKLIFEVQERAQKQNVFHFVSSHTYSHSARVEVLSTLIGSSPVLNLNDAEEFCLKEMVRDHDKGKIGIPEEILNKAGVLTEKEVAIIQMHTAISSILLNAETSLPFSPAVFGELYHHEMFLGNGYPTGRPLCTENIHYYTHNGEKLPVRLHLLVSVVSCADALDALTSKRPYKEPVSFYEATQVLIEYSFVHFHPLVVESLFERLSSMETADARKIDHLSVGKTQCRYRFYHSAFRLFRVNACYSSILDYYRQDHPAKDETEKYMIIRQLFFEGSFDPFFTNQAKTVLHNEKAAHNTDVRILEHEFKNKKNQLILEGYYNPLIIYYTFLEIGCAYRLLSFTDIEKVKDAVIPIIENIKEMNDREEQLVYIYHASLVLFLLETYYYIEYLDLNNIEQADYLLTEYTSLYSRWKSLRGLAGSLRHADYSFIRLFMREFYDRLLGLILVCEQQAEENPLHTVPEDQIIRLLQELGEFWHSHVVSD
ncbi:MAG: response regulator [Spirochaetales bacterium]|nr:response regulator [Spirochaetales bacterium]